MNAYRYALKIGLISPTLLLLTIKIKRSKKTYLGYPQLLSLITNFLEVNQRIKGDIHVAEFGVGSGGSAIVLSWLINKYGGILTLFDVFGRIPPPTQTDGYHAYERYEYISNEESESYYGNIPDLLQRIRKEIGNVCPLDRVEFVQGQYEESLSRFPIKHPLNLVHIDCDWYKSVQTVLAYLQYNLHDGAILQIDDYSYWRGAKTATDEAEWLTNFSRYLVGSALVIDTIFKNNYHSTIR